MNRRKLLSVTITASLSGCLFTSRGDGNTPAVETDPGQTATPAQGDPPTYRPSGSRTKDLEGEPFVSARIDTMPEPVPFEPWIELLEQPTNERPGRIEVGLSNRGDRPFSIYGGIPNPMGGGDASDAGIAIGTTPPDNEDGCPRKDGSAAAGALAHERVEPNHASTHEYHVFVIHDDSVCFPPGEHRFTGVRAVYESGDDVDPLLAFEWGFSLTAI